MKNALELRQYILTLIFVVAAFAAGWWFGSRGVEVHNAATKEQLARREAEIETVAHAINAAFFANKIYQEADIYSTEEQGRSRKSLLLSVLRELARAERYMSDSQGDGFLKPATHSLDLLGALDVNEFTQIVEGASLVESAQAPFLDPSHSEYDTVMGFVRRAFAWRRRQPRYPARVWLKAVSEKDAELLKTAFSERIRQEASAETWAEQLARYRKKLNAAQPGFDTRAFAFGSSTTWDQTGEVRVGEVQVWRKDTEYRTFDIVQEGDAWKLDEF